MPIRSLGDLVARFSRPVLTHAFDAPGATVVGSLRHAPVEIGGELARQVDGTTCGSACLVMLAASGDPALMEWLETGKLPAGPRPPEIPPIGAGQHGSAFERFGAAQRRVQELTSRIGLGLLPWPGRFGTPPWAAARVARFPGVRFVSRAVDDRGQSGAVMATQVANAVGRGYPVLLYVGGTLEHPAAAVPRHVVLAVPGRAARVTPHGEPLISIYEPAAGTVWELPLSELSDRRGPAPQFGHWSNIQWIVVPVPHDTKNQENP